MQCTSIDHRSRNSVHDWHFTLNKRLWQRAGLPVARLGICQHLTNHGGKAPLPWASGRGAISIRGDGAYPKYANLLGLQITCGLWTIEVDREGTSHSSDIQISSLRGVHPVVGGEFPFANRGVRKNGKRDTR